MLNPGLINQISGVTQTFELTGIMPEIYDTIEANYAGADFDVYTYKSLGNTVATLTVTWTNSTKTVLESIVRT